MTLSHQDKAPALPSFGDESKANLFPFALMCAGWIAPLLKFWAVVWDVFRPSDYVGGDVAPRLWLFLAAFAVSLTPWWLPASYYRVRRFEQSGRLYEALGIRVFRSVVPNGDLVNLWRRRREPGFRVISNRQSAAEFLSRTVVGEKSHLVLLLIGAGSSLYAWHIGWNGWAAYLGVANVLVNLYPILLQRYTRARIVRLLETGGRREARPSATSGYA